MIYSIKSTPRGFRVIKLDQNYDVLAVYEMVRDERNILRCRCPSQHQPCKHLTNLLPAFRTAKAIDSASVLDGERGFVHNPLAEWIDWGRRDEASSSNPPLISAIGTS